MLLSIIIGDLKTGVTNDWTTMTDNFGNGFICNETIRQRIRFGNNVNKKLELSFSSSNMRGFTLPEKTFISNNNKNMNLNLMNYWTKTEEEKEEYVDDSIVYITLINKNYQLISYTTDYDIVQTYKRKDAFQGCAIKLKEFNEHPIITMYVKDQFSNRFSEINVLSDEDGKLSYVKTVLYDKDVISSCRTELKKLNSKKRQQHFSITVKDKKIPTNTFIVSMNDADRLLKAIKEEGIENPNIIIVDQDIFDESIQMDINDKKCLENHFDKEISKARVRAVTTVGIKLPFDFCKKYKLLYIFRYDLDKKKLTCVRSN